MVELQAYQPGWADEFQREAVRLSEALGGRIDAVEHIGSTAVPSLLAKPIIDLAARASISADPFAMDPELAGLGCVQHTAGPKNHAVYVRSDSGRRTHILHVFNSEQWTHCNQRLFRDKLLHDADARRQYHALKRSLAGMADGRDYTAAKRSLIEKLLNEERAARGLPPTIAWDKEHAASGGKQTTPGSGQVSQKLPSAADVVDDAEPACMSLSSPCRFHAPGPAR